jgi:hypothetical protein
MSSSASAMCGRWARSLERWTNVRPWAPALSLVQVIIRRFTLYCPMSAEWCWYQLSAVQSA